MCYWIFLNFIQYHIKKYTGDNNMIEKEYVEKVMKHKHALIFVGGIATAIVGKKILESKTVKDACTQGMATVMVAKKDAEECFQDMKDNAEDIVVDANSEVKKEIYVEENKE